MPTYDYKCSKCGHRFEKFQSMSDKPVRKCPKCAGKTERLIGTGAGIIFKGSGFYQTDYRSAKYHEAAKKDKPSDCGGSGSCASKSKSGSTCKSKKDK